jgi:hypothetical protein
MKKWKFIVIVSVIIAGMVGCVIGAVCIFL